MKIFHGGPRAVRESRGAKGQSFIHMPSYEKVSCRAIESNIAFRSDRVRHHQDKPHLHVRIKCV